MYCLIGFAHPSDREALQQRTHGSFACFPWLLLTAPARYNPVTGRTGNFIDMTARLISTLLLAAATVLVIYVWRKTFSG